VIVTDHAFAEKRQRERTRGIVGDALPKRELAHNVASWLPQPIEHSQRIVASPRRKVPAK
jgi:hypothetical protein